MIDSPFANAFMGILQLAVPSYGLRLSRLFGSREVGWALVVAFLGLALLHLASGLGSAGAWFDCTLARGVVGAVIPVLLLIGMVHVEILFRDRARIEQEQRLRVCEVEQLLDRRTDELAEAREEFHWELSCRDHEQQAVVERAQRERLDLGVQVAARAGQHLNRHVAVIELYAKLLLAKQSGLGPTQYYERLVAEAAEARGLGRQLLACGCRQPLRTQLLSLSDMVRRHEPTLRKLLGKHGLLECTCPADAPVVWADPPMLRWMLEELVRNACDAAADAGRVSITVERVKVDRLHSGKEASSSQFVALIVTDSGRGMSREEQKRLGEPFFTTDPVRRTGLGLASVSGLMKAHGGWLEVKSALGHGTSVRLLFPSAAARPLETLALAGLATDRGELV